MKRVLGSLMALSLILLIFIPNIQAGDVKIKYPIIFLDTCDALMSDAKNLDLFCGYVEIKYDFISTGAALFSSQQLVSGTGLPGVYTRHYYDRTFKSGFPDGTPYNTIVFLIGVNIMSMNWSEDLVNGVIRQIKSNIEWAKENEVKIVGMHLGGERYRSFRVGGEGNSYNEELIDSVAPMCDILIVQSSPGNSDGNFDGKFTKIAEEHNIDLYASDLLGCFYILKSLIEE